MANLNKLCIIAITLMSFISFANLLGLNAAGFSVLVGVAIFFVNNAIEKEDSDSSGLDFKAIPGNLRSGSIWFWIALPFVMDVIAIGLSFLILPEYVEYELTRTASFVSLNNFSLLVIQLAVLALGEEIAWRAFFQKQLQKVLPITPVITISSFLFAIGHITDGNFSIVAYNVFFVGVNSILYSIVFHKTNNAWISTISHFTANLLSIIILLPF